MDFGKSNEMKELWEHLTIDNSGKCEFEAMKKVGLRLEKKFGFFENCGLQN